MAPVPQPDPAPDPTMEIGSANLGVLPWSGFHDVDEMNAELGFPAGVRVYKEMRNDDQLSALMMAFLLPIFGYRWFIDPNGARDEVVEHVASDFGLPIEGEDDGNQGRQRDRFSHSDYLRHSMLKLPFGFTFFEQVYRYGEDDEKFHIRKLAPRLPGSIMEIKTARDGGLTAIKQFPSGYAPDLFTPQPNRPNDLVLGYDAAGPVIPVARLIAHINDKEGGNWYGQSWFRSLYRNWTIKDRLLRVDALKHERNGMGVPTGLTREGTSEGAIRKLLAVVTRWKAGETAAAALPPGTDIELKGVKGTLPDTLASVRYHDEQMARRFIASVYQLGSTQTGSRALGETLGDAMGVAQESVAKSYADTTNAHAIEDLVDINYSIDESAPLLRFSPDRSMSTEQLTELIKVGGITVDKETENWIRSERDVPQLVGERERIATVTPIQPVDAAAAQRDRIVMSATGPRLAAEQRKPNEHEKAAKTDFDALNRSFEDAVSFLLGQWNGSIKPAQITSLVDQIAATVTFDEIAAIQAPVLGADLLTSELERVATQAISLAVQEAKAQGITIDTLAIDEFSASIASRSNALASVMADSITEAAARRALSQAGNSYEAGEVAAAVREHLESLTDTYLKDSFGPAVHTAQNDARLTTLDQGPIGKWYASEINDQHICANCEEINDTEYDTLAEGRKDYPTGFYGRCLGWVRCRGTLVGIYDEEQAPTVEDVL